MGMMMRTLRAFIPDHVWDAVEKNIISMGEKVSALQADNAANRQMLMEIRATLNEALETHTDIYERISNIEKATHGKNGSTGV
jgi:hypothetical protein